MGTLGESPQCQVATTNYYDYQLLTEKGAINTWQLKPTVTPHLVGTDWESGHHHLAITTHRNTPPGGY